MIAKILTPSQNFAAIQYNEKKCKSGDATLIHTENFGYLDLLDIKSESDYKNYLIDWSSKNLRVQSPQFHVAISDKGKSKTPEELLDIAKSWLKEMGYSGLPTMFYFHDDTANNHIHIVTSRIGTDGKKINDSNERYRARSIINRLCNNDLYATCRKDLAKALSYNYSSNKQFEAIMSSMGYNTKIEEGKISIWREGDILLERNIDIITWAAQRKIYDHQRQKQLKAIFLKYSKGLDFNDFAKLMQSKFGISLITFGKENAPYGYTVIDHAAGNVYKGSDIVNLKLLLSQKTKLEDKVQSIIEATLQIEGSISHKKINSFLREAGVYIKGNNVIVKGNSNILMSLDHSVYEKLKAGDKIEIVNSYAPRNIDEALVLSKRYNLPMEYIGIEPDAVRDISMMKAIFNSDKPIDDIVTELGLNMMHGDLDKYIIDPDGNNIYSFSELNLVNDQMIALRSNQKYQSNEDAIDNIVESILNNQDDQGLGGGVNNELPKKKKR